MRKIIIIALMLSISSLSLADSRSSSILTLPGVFKSPQHRTQTINPNDVTMGYTGEDVTKQITSPVNLVA